MKLDVNTDSAIQLTAKLEKLHKSAFPSAVRNTLNDAAFDMKQKTVLESARKNFKSVKEPRLLKNSLLVKKATGFDVKNMTSRVGLIRLKNDLEAYVSGLEKQETGGIIDTGARYLKGARGGNKANGRVRTENYYDKDKVISGRSKRKGTRKSKFIARMYMSLKLGKPFFGNSMKGNMLFKTITASTNRNSRQTKYKIVPLMMSRSKVVSKIKRTNFMSEAAEMTGKKLEIFYNKNANFQFKKHLK